MSRLSLAKLADRTDIDERAAQVHRKNMIRLALNYLVEIISYSRADIASASASSGITIADLEVLQGCSQKDLEWLAEKSHHNVNFAMPATLIRAVAEGSPPCVVDQLRSAMGTVLRSAS